MRIHKKRSIPAFLSFDVEPDGFQVSQIDSPEWPGYGAMFEIAERLRSRLIERSGATPRFGWYFRTDPQIAEVYGEAVAALVEFPERIVHLKTKGDYFGVHPHPIRWSHSRQLWVHDIENRAWTAYCIKFALEAFGRWQGSPAERFRAGGANLTNTMIETLESYGVKVELSLEPVKGWWLYSRDVATGIDSSPIIGRYTDCDTAPREVYRPARDDFRVRGGRASRNIILIPCSTTPVRSERSGWSHCTALPVEEADQVNVLYPSIEWPSPEFFWDLVAERLRSMPNPYVSLGVRTDAPGSILFARVRTILDALPRHPLATCLRFEDPVDVAPNLLGSQIHTTLSAISPLRCNLW
ncbi:MAG TPA: hypothetical protein VGH22_22550 [Candidatus Binatia bacterium]